MDESRRERRVVGEEKKKYTRFDVAPLFACAEFDKLLREEAERAGPDSR